MGTSHWAQNFELELSGPKFVPPKAYLATPSPSKLCKLIFLVLLLFRYFVIAVVVTCCSLKRESGQSQCLLFYSCPLPCPARQIYQKEQFLLAFDFWDD